MKKSNIIISKNEVEALMFYENLLDENKLNP